MRSIRSAVVALALAGSVAFTVGCGSFDCVGEGDQVSVTLRASADLNDAGAGPQHVRYRVWAVRNAEQFRETFESNPESMVKDAPRVLEESGLGKAFPAGSSWITPATPQTLRLTVPEDVTYTHVGVVVLYPTPQSILVALDCDDRVGYANEGDVHTVVVDLGRDSLAPGALPGDASE